MKDIEVSASVVVHDSPLEELCALLDSLSRSAVDRVWVVYNGTDPGFGEKLAGRDVKYLEVENNGYGAAHNVAMREAIAAGSRYHLVVNPDVRWEDDVISSMKSYFKTHSEAGILSPAVYYPDGRLQYNARMLPGPFDLLARRLLPDFMLRSHSRKYLLQDLDLMQPVNAPYLLGCFMFFRVEAILECGMFDERFFMYPEDIDITRRFHRKWHTLRLPRVRIVHDHRRASAKNLRMLWIHVVNMARYFRKWGWFADRERRVFNRRLRDNFEF